MKRRIAVALLVPILATGCSTGDPRVQAATDKGTRANLISQLESLPGLTVDADVKSSLDGGQGNVGVHVTVPVAESTAQINSVADSLERTVWLSHLDPLGVISIVIFRRGSAVKSLQRLYLDDRSELRAKYGPRPDGLD
jgi:hypothetical protein